MKRLLILPMLFVIGCTQLDRAATALVTAPPTSMPVTQSESDAALGTAIKGVVSTVPGGEYLVGALMAGAGYYLYRRKQQKPPEAK